MPSSTNTWRGISIIAPSTRSFTILSARNASIMRMRVRSEVMPMPSRPLIA